MKKLNSDVLVLNTCWIPIDIINVKDAFRLVVKGNAKILETIHGTYMLHTIESWLDFHMHEQYSKINTVSLEIPIPEIIVLSYYDKLPNKTLKFTKENLLIRDNYQCVYCQKELNEYNVTMDHVVPRALGGKTTWENCVSACSNCNHDKADNPPHGKYRPKKHPKEPNHVSPWYSINKKTKKKNDIPDSWSKFLFK